MGGKILIVDDDREAVALLGRALGPRGFTVDAVTSGAEALVWLRDHTADVVLAHLRMAAMSGVELCLALREAYPEMPTLVVTGDSSLASAIAAIRAGAYDYITKPIDLDALVVAIERAVAQPVLTRERQPLRVDIDTTRPIASIVGDSAAIRKVVAAVHKIADSDATVLIVGESGTGKELVARAIHETSSRQDHAYAAINCAALSPGLLESELFGYVKGAFTDARASRLGLFAQARGGTVFLDEIGEMPLEMQVKLLRVLQERSVRPVGGDEEVPFAARVIAATNRPLEADVAEGRFREDLYYRINVVQIALPPLRARPGDIPALADHFIHKIAARAGKPVLGLGAEAARVLAGYDWPGNVRELENCLERAVALTTSSEITVEDLPERVRHHPPSIVATATALAEELQSLAEIERRYVAQVLHAVGGNKTMAAKILGIDRRSLYRRLDGDPPARGGR